MLHCMYIYFTKFLTNSTKQSCKIKCMIVNLDKLSTILYSNFSNTCVHIFHKGIYRNIQEDEICV